jgi:hypothetical protein
VKDFDFTLTKYQQLCGAIVNSGYLTTTVRAYIANPPASVSSVVILRHDVDRKPDKAIDMAVLERRLGISSTYYFRTTGNVFKEKAIRKIANLGHEIGYHYETLSRAKGDYCKAIRLFQEELVALRKIVNVSTISMHGSPLSKWDNRWLWEKYDFHKFQLLGEAYLSIDYSQMAYLTDTGRSWNATTSNIRDRVQSKFEISVQTTDDLIQLVRSKVVPKMCIQTHPERWDHNLSGWLRTYICDTVSNCIKPIAYRLILAKGETITGSK